MLRDDVSVTFALGEGFGDAKEVGQSDYNTSVGSDLCEMLSGISDALEWLPRTEGRQEKENKVGIY